MKLEIIVLSEISKLRKPSITCSWSFVEPRPKIMVMMMMIVIMKHEHIWGTLWEGSMGAEKGKVKDTKG
jgi:hypothetical protein